MKILLIIPAFNEAGNIEKLLERITHEYPQYDYIVVNDGSLDETVDICQAHDYHVLHLPVNLGIGGAVQTGYRYAWEHDVDIAVQLDGDGQHDVSYVEKLIAPILSGEADITIGSRFMEKNGFQSSSIRRLGIKWLSGVIHFASGVKILDVTSGFRAVNRKYIELYQKEYSSDYPEPEAIVAAAMQNARIVEVPVIMQERQSGKSSINPGRSIYYMIKVTLAILICRFSFGFGRKK